MNRALLRRLEVLEGRMASIVAPRFFRYGWLRRLPKEYIGEKHVVVVKRVPTGSPNFEWFESEERPGPAPPGDDDGFNIYLANQVAGPSVELVNSDRQTLTDCRRRRIERA